MTNFKILGLIYIFWLIFLSSSLVSSQNFETFNIDLPNDHEHGMITDIYQINDGSIQLIVIYAFNQIITYQTATHTFVDEIEIPGNFAKHTVLFNELYRIPAQSFMAYDAGDNQLFFLSPELDLYSIKINSINGSFQGELIDWEIGISSPGLYGYPVMRYDDSNNRLFLAVNGPNLAGSSFNCIFRILTVEDFDSPDIDVIYSNNQYSDIYDIAFSKLNSDYYYLSVKDFWVIRKISNTSFNKAIVVGPGNSNTKNGWFLYVELSGQQHYVCCLPHDDHYDSTYSPAIILIDANDTTFTSVQSPTAVVNSGIHDVTNDRIIIGVTHSTDIDPSVYYYNDESFELLETVTLDDDLNPTPFSIVVGENGEALLSRKDCITVINNNFSDTNIYSGFNNYFFKSFRAGVHYFVSNLLGSAIEVIDSDFDYEASVITGSPVYESGYNSSNQNVFFFNRLNSGNSRIWFVDPSEDDSVKSITSEYPIGDCVYNPFQDHYLVTLFTAEDPDNDILVYNADLQPISQMFDCNDIYCGPMYITPTGKLIVTRHMSSTNSFRFNIYDATNYSFIDSVRINIGLLNSLNLDASFCFDEVNNRTFIAAGSVNSSVTDDQITGNSGLLLELAEDNVLDTLFTYSSRNPGKIVYSPAAERIFICCTVNINSELTANLDVFDLVADELTQTEIPAKDIGYDKTEDKLYITGTEDNSLKVWQMSCSDTNFSTSEIVNHPGQEPVSLFYSDFLRKLFVYSLPADTSQERDVEIIQYDVQQDSATSIVINKCLPWLYSYTDHTRNTFIDDPYHGRIYIPGGMRSEISYVTYDYEYFPLENEITWFSFPRLDRQGNDFYPADSALNDRIYPDFTTQDLAVMQHYWHDPVDPLQTTTINITKNGTSPWSYNTGNLDQVQSSLGYIMSMDLNDQEDRLLKMTGYVLNPQTLFTVYESDITDKEGFWAGYFLPQVQHPAKAFTQEYLDDIRWIKGRYWYCETYTNETKSSEVMLECACEQGKVELKYGDLVKINASSRLMDFQWQVSEEVNPGHQKQSSQYYQYVEQTNYTPFILELDTLDHPLEIGAFAGDSCIGSTRIGEGDTLALIRGFTEGWENEPVSFEMYYGLTKESPSKVSHYSVRNPLSLEYENRTIFTGENQVSYRISFQNKSTSEKILSCEPKLEVFPNPLYTRFTIQYELKEEAEITVRISNIFGYESVLLEKAERKPGKYSFTWEPAASRLPGGIYLVSLNTGQYLVSKKIVIISH